jgi:tRNA modification GTPase
MDNNKTLDEVLISILKDLMRTGENTIEISCHGSTYIQQQFSCYFERLLADAGEFTLRALLNGKLDFVAEAVADLISSDK